MKKRQFLALACAAPLGAQSGGARRTIDLARMNFARAVAVAFNREPRSFQVIPLAGVEPGETFAALRTGELHAWTAEEMTGKSIVCGFASAGPETAIAFENYQGGLGQAAGIAPLLRACHVLDRRTRLPVKDLVARVAFCLNRWERGEFLYDPAVAKSSGFESPKGVGPPSLRAQKQGMRLTYFTMIPGNTGTFGYVKVTITIMDDYTTTIDRQEDGF